MQEAVCVECQGSAMVALWTDRELSSQEQPRQSGSDSPGPDRKTEGQRGEKTHQILH